MHESHLERRIADDLRALGVGAGDVLMVHSSLKSLGVVPGGPESVIRGLLRAIGPSGTLLMPALSYLQQPPDVHDSRRTPSNVGAVPEYFRLRDGTVRSVHPTHSACGLGPAAGELFAEHALDRTPCGPHSPFSRMIDRGAKIVMLGCGLRPNTTMHALEELCPPPYLFGQDRQYLITDWQGRSYSKVYRTHGFAGWRQRYDRVATLSGAIVREGTVLEARTHLIDAAAMRTAVVARLQDDPLYFVEPASAGPARPPRA